MEAGEFAKLLDVYVRTVETNELAKRIEHGKGSAEMTRNLEARLAKLEFSRKPRGGYVVHFRKPPTESELAEIEQARIEGRAIVTLHLQGGHC